MFIRIASVSELPQENEAREFTAGDKTFCIANVDGEYRALDNTCPHRGGALGQGVVEGRHVVCPWHGWQIDSTTGTSLQNASLGVKTYDIKLEGEDVLLDV